MTRMKENAVYEVREELQVPQNSNVVCDQIVCFPRLAREGEEPVVFRRVEIWDEEKRESIVFLSNLLAFGATTIAAIYKERWQVELFFKALKQTLNSAGFFLAIRPWSAPQLSTSCHLARASGGAISGR